MSNAAAAAAAICLLFLFICFVWEILSLNSARYRFHPAYWANSYQPLNN